MKETLCWTCQVPGTGGCSWDQTFQPVEGWEAEPTKLRAWEKGGYGTDSFIVKSCPLYRPIQQQGRDSSTGGRASVLSDEALERYIFSGFTDQEIARRSGLALSTVIRRRQKFWRERERKA